MQTLAPIPGTGASLAVDRIAPAPRQRDARLSRLSVPAAIPNGNVLSAMDRSAANLTAIPAPSRRANTRRQLPKPVRTGPTTMQTVGKAIAHAGNAAAVTGKALGSGAKKTLKVIDRSLEGFD